MLNIKENKSYNNFVITGTLSTIDVKEGRSKSTDAYPQGRDYVRVNAMVRLDQEINGVLTQCEVPIELYANKDYSKGDVNPIYTNGQKFKDFISLSAAGDKPEKQQEFLLVLMVKRAAQLTKMFIFQLEQIRK